MISLFPSRFLEGNNIFQIFARNWKLEVEVAIFFSGEVGFAALWLTENNNQSYQKIRFAPFLMGPLEYRGSGWYWHLFNTKSDKCCSRTWLHMWCRHDRVFLFVSSLLVHFVFLQCKLNVKTWSATKAVPPLNWNLGGISAFHWGSMHHDITEAAASVS